MRYTLNGTEVSREQWLQGSPGFTPGCPPQSRTDVEFLRGMDKQFNHRPDIGDATAKISKEHGLGSTKGLVYLSALADFPGDPQAWISGKSDIRRVVEGRGYSCSGDVSIKGPGITEEPKFIGVDPDLIEEEVNRMIAADPSLAFKDKQELREQVAELRRGYH